MPGRRDGHQSHTGRRRRAPQRLPREQRERPVLRYEDVLHAVVVGSGSLEPLDIPPVVEADLLARYDGHPHVGHAFADPAHLSVVHREEPCRDVFRMACPRAETPRPAQRVAAVHRAALPIGEELATHRHPVLVCGEHLRESFVGQIRRRRERRRQVRDTDPSEGAVLPRHFDPGFDHLAERRFDSPGLDGIERRHQTAGPHRLDDLRREGACPFGLRGLGLHEFAHAPCESYNPVIGFDSRRHVLTLTT